MNTTPPVQRKSFAAPFTDLFADGFDLRETLLKGRAFFALIVIIIVFGFLSPNYLSVNNLLQMSAHVAVFAILAMGMLMVILNGGIDLSVGSTVGFTGIIAGALMQGIDIPAFGIKLFPAVWVVVLIALASGAFIGYINGILISRFKVAPFVATLGMLYVVRGAALLITGSLTYPDLQGSPELGNTGFNWLGFNRILEIPIGVVIMLVLALYFSGVLNRTVFGRWIYASGGNERAAELSGIPVKRVQIRVYVISGLCAALSGIIIASELTSANPTAGETYELTAIAAVVIGGASLAGGRGTIRGTLLGAFVIGFLSDGLVIIGVSEYWQMIFKGAVIVLAVLLNAVEYKSRKKGPNSPPPTASVVTIPSASADGTTTKIVD
jgi:erythritol transport system permease protein